MSDRAQEIAEELLCGGDRRIQHYDQAFADLLAEAIRAEVQRARDEAEAEVYRREGEEHPDRVDECTWGSLCPYCEIIRQRARESSLRARVEQCRDAMMSLMVAHDTYSVHRAKAAADKELGQ